MSSARDLPPLPSESHPNPRVQAAISRADRHRLILMELAELGMGLAREVVSRTARAPLDEEPARDPGRTFAQVARAVRFTLAMETAVEDRLLALCNGTPLDVVAGVARWGTAVGTAPSDRSAFSCPKHPREAVWVTVDETEDDTETTERSRETLRERLLEHEDFDEFLDLPWRSAIAAICADLGVEPDWSRWSDGPPVVHDPGQNRIKGGGPGGDRPEAAGARGRSEVKVLAAAGSSP